VTTAWRTEWPRLALITAVFVAAVMLPVGTPRFDNGVTEALELLRWYAREHVVLCLLPAFYIAGAIGVFVSQASVMRYLGPEAPKALAYGVASVSGTILAVCSCTVLPLFAGIFRMGAGLGPASAFLYAGPAVNVLAIILTARILGIELGVARAVGAVGFSVIIGLAMHALFRHSEARRAPAASQAPMAAGDTGRPLSRNVLYFAAMIAVLVFANWGSPAEETTGLFRTVGAMKWPLTIVAAVGLAAILIGWLGLSWRKAAVAAAAAGAAALLVPSDPRVPFGVGAVALGAALSRETGELGEWFEASWGFAKQILPLLLVGIVVAGALLGRPGHEGWFPGAWVAAAVGGNSLRANLLASVAGAFMYFATLTEVPIVQGLLGSGMGKGPALALLLAGPALSLPSILVLRSVIGGKRTLVYVVLVVVMATVAGVVFGTLT
jgi:uncharacterized membrane protein YraQ (UPF0718 family)